MNEQALSQELRRVADAVPVPSDLFPTGLLERPVARRRRPGWLIAAAVAAALLLFVGTPSGARLVAAAGELFMRVTVKRIQPDSADYSPYQPITWPTEIGHSTDRTLNGSKEVLTRIRIKDLPTDIPLPTYKPPDETAQVYRHEWFQADTGELKQTAFMILWAHVEGNLVLHFQLTITRYAEPKSAGTQAQVDQGVKVEQREVTVKGQPATALRFDGPWFILWSHRYGNGSLRGTVALEELLKMAESMPDLK